MVLLNLWHRATLRELALALLCALGVIALTGIPYGLGYLLARPGTEYMGLLMNAEDSNSYLAKMEQGYAGEWLYTIPYTAEPQTPEPLGGFYIVLGQLARLVQLSITQMWHVARVVSALCLFLVTFGFIKSFVSDARTRWIAYLLAITGSGLGWLLFLFGQTFWLGAFPVDFKMPESHLFFTALTFPHFAMGTTLVLVSVWLSVRAIQTEQWRPALAAGVVNLALVIVYPFLIYLSAVVLGLNYLNLCLEGKRLRLRSGILAAITMLIPAPLLLYYFYVLKTNPVFSAWDAQSVTLSPNPLHYVIAYGALLALAAPTLRQREFRPLWLWVLAVALLVYAPLNPQRRFVEGIQVPLAILAAGGLVAYFLPRLRMTRLFQKIVAWPNYSVAGLERLLVTFILILFALSNVYVLASTSLTAALEQPYPFFRSTAQVSAVDWASANLPHGAVVLADYETGNFIPTRGSLKTVVGHWAETMNYEQKEAEVKKFFDSATTEAWRMDLISAQHVDYVFYTSSQVKAGFNFSSQCIYSTGNVFICPVSNK